MKSKENKKVTVEALDAMIQQVAKGPSGFWVEDYQGCGNPKIFPEFEEGLKQGRLVKKEHYLCPWNTAVLYGKGYGDINTGCYYSCCPCCVYVFIVWMLFFSYINRQQQ